MNRTHAICLVALVAVGLTATPATAATKVATYTGILGFGSSLFDTAVPSFIDLNGTGFTATFTYNTSLGERGTDPFFGTDIVIGGPDVGRPFTPSPMLGITFALDGFGPTSDFAFLTRSGSISTNWGPVLPGIGHSAYVDGTSSLLVSGGLNPPQIGLDTNVALTPIGGFGTTTLIQGSRILTGALILRTVQIADLDPGGPVDPPAPGVVPEPASWALLILGFGLVGTAARRRTAGRRIA